MTLVQAVVLHAIPLCIEEEGGQWVFSGANE